MFSGLNQGNTLYVLSIKNGIKHYACPIEYISPTRAMYPTYTAGVSNGMNMGSTLDITVNVDGKKKEFSGIPALNSVSTSDDYIITDNKEAMVSLVDNILLSSQTHLNNIDVYKRNVEDCKGILKSLNPVYAKETAMDDAITELTNRVNNMQSEFGEIKGNVGLILNILTDKK